jgi:hypothetical protein
VKSSILLALSATLIRRFAENGLLSESSGLRDLRSSSKFFYEGRELEPRFWVDMYLICLAFDGLKSSTWSGFMLLGDIIGNITEFN